MIDVQQVRELIELMVEHELTEIRIKEGETTVSLRRGGAGQMVLSGAPMTVSSPGPMVPATAAPAPVGDENDGLVAITSPMVGTLYTAPDPESPPFVSIGQQVDDNVTVCIIEAMKVFNEIKAEVSGTIERFAVQSGQAVEFGQPLMYVRPKS